jgi:hypothetical protein
MTENVEHYLKWKEAARMKAIEGGKTGEAKKLKNKNKYLKLQEHTRVAKLEYHKRAGTYRKGMNVDDPFGELLNGQEVPVDERKRAATKRKKEVGFCEYCGNSNHLTKRSKKCSAPLDASKKFRRHDGSSLAGPPTCAEDEPPLFPPVAAGIPLNDAAQDTDRFDSLPWNHELDSDEDSMAFHDAGTWDSDVDDDSVRCVGGTL